MALPCNNKRDSAATFEIARLQKPVSQVRILPGALRVFAVQGAFQTTRRAWAPDVNDPAGRDFLADVAAIGPGWDCIIVRIQRQPGAADGGRPSE